MVLIHDMILLVILGIGYCSSHLKQPISTVEDVEGFTSDFHNELKIINVMFAYGVWIKGWNITISWSKGWSKGDQFLEIGCSRLANGYSNILFQE